MRLFSNAALIATIALAVTAAAPEDGGPDGPVDCSGSLLGDALTTTAEFQNGYALVAPWKVVNTSAAERVPGVRNRVLEVRLDRVIEREAVTGRSVTMPFPATVETKFEGENDDDLVHQAAQVWCVTVIKVKSEGSGFAPADSRPPVVRASLRQAQRRAVTRVL